MKKPTIDVVPSGREWLVKRSDEEVVISSHRNEYEAMENAHRIAEIEQTEVAFRGPGGKPLARFTAQTRES